MPGTQAALRFVRSACAIGLVVVLLARSCEAAAPIEWRTPADTSSPRATLRGFLVDCNRVHALIIGQKYLRRDDPETRPLAKRVLDCLDVSGLPEYARTHAATEAAICIKEVLDRVELPDWEEVPDADTVAEPDAADRYRIPGTRLTIVRMSDGPRKHEWLFSQGTVARAIEYFEDLESTPYRESGEPTSPGLHAWYLTAPGSAAIASIVGLLPAPLRQPWFGVSLWKWLGVGAASLVCVSVMYGAYRTQRWLGSLCGDQRPVRYLLTLAFPAAAIAIPAFYKGFVANAVGLRGDPLYVVSFAASVLTLLALVILVASAIDRIAALLLARPDINPRGLDAQVIRIVARLAGIAAATFVLLEGGQYLGIPLTTLLASAGVGGLAMALAAQDTLRNLFGTIMLMTDKPFRMGERIVANGYDGVVEDIGLRSTRIRLLTGHLVTIPNDTLARNDIENIGRRPFIRQDVRLRVPMRATPAQVSAALETIRAELADHEGMSPDFPPRVSFVGFEDDAYAIRVLYWYHPADYWQFSEFTDRLNLRLIARLAEQGIDLEPITRVANGPDDAGRLRVEVSGQA